MNQRTDSSGPFFAEPFGLNIFIFSHDILILGYYTLRLTQRMMPFQPFNVFGNNLRIGPSSRWFYPYLGKDLGSRSFWSSLSKLYQVDIKAVSKGRNRPLGSEIHLFNKIGKLPWVILIDSVTNEIASLACGPWIPARSWENFDNIRSTATLWTTMKILDECMIYFIACLICLVWYQWYQNV